MSRKFLFLTLALLAVILLSGCSNSAVRGTTWPGLAVSNDVAYLADGSLVYAINLKDGQELWHYPAKGSSKLLYYSTPVITPDGLVVVGSAGNDHTLVAINPNDIDQTSKAPVEAWKFSGAQDHWVAPPLVVENLLFAPNADGNLYVFDLSDGQTNKRPVKVVELGGRLWGQPVTDDKYIFVTSLDHHVFAIDKQTYNIVWREDLGAAIPNSPVLGPDGSLYVGSFASGLEKFDPATGKHQSVEKTSGWVWGMPVLVENNLYFGDLSGYFYSFNIDEGKYDWKPVKPDGPITASPLVANDAFLVATESDGVFRLDKEGNSKLWSQPGGKIYTTPMLAGNLVLVAPLGAEFYLYAYDVNDGHQAWAFKPGN
jgi:outer membrane protein assembly factor BamB